MEKVINFFFDSIVDAAMCIQYFQVDRIEKSGNSQSNSVEHFSLRFMMNYFLLRVKYYLKPKMVKKLDGHKL